MPNDNILRFPHTKAQRERWTVWRASLIGVGVVLGIVFVGLTIYRIATLN
jgi:hypothetical protein